MLSGDKVLMVACELSNHSHQLLQPNGQSCAENRKVPTPQFNSQAWLLCYVLYMFLILYDIDMVCMVYSGIYIYKSIYKSKPTICI